MWRFPEIEFLPDIVRYWASETPAKVALRAGELSLSYKQLDERSSQVANRLLAAGIRPGSRVAYVGRNAPEYFVIWFAVVKLGCAIVPLNWRCAVPELANLIDDAKPPLVFAEQSMATSKMLEVKKQCQVSFDIVGFDINEGSRRLDEWVGDASTEDPDLELKALDEALLVYTSGTTGQPKGVIYSQQSFNYSFLSLSLDPDLAWTEDDVALMVMPNFHLGGNWVPLPALYHGGTISILPEFEVQTVIETIKQHQCSVLPIVPTALKMLTDSELAERQHFESLKRIFYFGSPIGAKDIIKAIDLLGCRISQLYGTSENWLCTLLTHEDHVADNYARLASCGKPLPLVSIKVCDANGNMVPDNEVGEIYIKTPILCSGSWKTTDKSRRRKWFATGDLGRRDLDGFFYLMDRAKDMIISGGENIYSVEVERALNRHAEVNQSAVIGVPDAKWGEKVLAFVTLKEGHMLSEEDLRRHCRGLLADYKVPKEVRIVDDLPITTTGKIQKHILRAPFWENNLRNIS